MTLIMNQRHCTFLIPDGDSNDSDDKIDDELKSSNEDEEYSDEDEDEDE